MNLILYLYILSTTFYCLVVYQSFLVDLFTHFYVDCSLYTTLILCNVNRLKTFSNYFVNLRMMSVLRNVILFLIHAMYMRHQLRLIPSNNLFKNDNLSCNIKCNCTVRAKTPICTNSSSSTDLRTFSTVESTTKLSTPDMDYPMLGDDPLVHTSVETTSQLTPKHESPNDYSSTTTVTEEIYNPVTHDQNSPSMATDETTNDNNTLSGTPQVTDRSVKKLINDAFSDFIMNYSTVLFSKLENMVVCPVSMADLMFLISYGACFHTLNTVDIVPKLPQKTRYNFRFIKSFINRHSNISTNGILIGHKIFIPDDVKVSEKFSKIVQQVSNSNLQQINFIETEEAAKIINNWSANRTSNTITNVVNAGQFNNETSLVLISVASFNCSWLKPFDPDRTKQIAFSGIEKYVWTMNQEIQCRYGILSKLDNSTYVELFIDTKSAKNPMRMIIILPDETKSLSNIVPKFSQFKLEDLDVDAEKNVLVNISLPRFKIRTTINLKDYQKAMGMNTIFSDGAAFKRITKSRHLKVSDFIQTSVIDVNEGNHHSGSSTNAEINEVDSSITRKNFHVNRPFIILIANNYIIFASAQVLDPFQESF